MHNVSPGIGVKLHKIISGGQTGVDRAALDIAIELSISHGGWCPYGRLAEDGRIHDRYLLTELDTPEYSVRTKRNVLDSDGTLVLYSSTLQGGTLMTSRYAINQNKPCLKIRLSHPGKPARVYDWLAKHQIETLNIAGPRASKEPEVYDKACDYLRRIFGDLTGT